MTEEEAQHWLAARFEREDIARVREFVDLVIAENARHNLISPATIPLIWSRHVVDSAQLITLGGIDGLWVDIGSGGGFPGMIVGLLRDRPIALLEPRRLRAQFLTACATRLGIADRVTITPCRVEEFTQNADIMSARAVASAEKLLQAASHCATIGTRWLLPRGKSATDDLAIVQKRWSGVFHVEQSITDHGAGILVLDQVKAR